MVWRINQGKKFHTVLRDGWAAIAARRAFASDPHAATILITVTQKASGNE